MTYIKTSEGTRQGGATRSAKYPSSWQCPGCNDENKSYWTNCPNCSEPRPKA